MPLAARAYAPVAGQQSLRTARFFRAPIPNSHVAYLATSGHKTRPVFDSYNI
jgi:hypothetical protein